jgi:hypothetical protein
VRPEAKVIVATIALVADRPGAMTAKTCAMVLAGSSSPKLREAGLDQLRLFGCMRGRSARALSRHVAAVVAAGHVARRADGLLLPGKRPVT